MSDPANKYSAKDWDEIRSAFAASIMVNTPLSSLAQNLDGPDWPVRGKKKHRPRTSTSVTMKCWRCWR